MRGAWTPVLADLEVIMSTLIDYIAIEDALRTIDSDTEAAESHGILCGMVCSSGRADVNVWIQQLLDTANMEMSDPLANESIEQFTQLYQDTVEQLNDVEMGFRLLLPEEDEDLLDSVRALSEWCNGFLLGFGLGANRADDKLPDEVKELLTDFVEITRVDAEDTNEDDQDMGSFIEIMEYVRVGVILIQELMHPVRGPSTLQ